MDPVVVGLTFSEGMLLTADVSGEALGDCVLPPFCERVEVLDESLFTIVRGIAAKLAEAGPKITTALQDPARRIE